MTPTLPSVFARRFCYGLAAGSAAHAAFLAPFPAAALFAGAAAVASLRTPRFTALLLGFALAWARFDAHLAPLVPDAALSGVRTFTAEVREVHDRGARASALLADLVLEGAGEARRVEGTVTLSLDRFAAPEPRALVRVRCALRPPEADGPFAAARIRDRIRAACFDPSLVEELAPPSAPFRALQTLRVAVRTGIGAALPSPHAELASGLLVGGSVSPLPAERREEFRRTGTSHIVAASGYNVSLVVFWIFAAAGALPLRRRARLALALPAAWGYAALAGADPPVLRAAAMATAVLAARLLGRATFPLHALVLAAGAMLWANPALLVFDVGFELSLAATAGILLLAPVLAERSGPLARLPTAPLLIQTLAAITATLPIVMLRFGSVSSVALVANLAVLPMVPPAMAASAATAIPGALAPSIAPFAGLLAWLPLSYILGVTRLLAALPGASADLGRGAAVAACAVTIARAVMLRRKRPPGQGALKDYDGWEIIERR